LQRQAAIEDCTPAPAVDEFPGQLSHDCVPAWTLKVCAEHGRQAVPGADRLPVYPRSHRHADRTTRPVAEVFEKSGQGVHEAPLTCSLYRPTAHCLHCDTAEPSKPALHLQPVKLTTPVYCMVSELLGHETQEELPLADL
jgi:hypothetical protein